MVVTHDAVLPPFEAEAVTITLSRAEWADVIAALTECGVRAHDLELDRLAGRIQSATLPHELKRDDLLVRSLHKVTTDDATPLPGLEP